MRGDKNPVAVIRRILHKTNRILNECKFCVSSEEEIVLASFQADLTTDACQPGLAETFATTLYHNGEGPLPVLGDIIYSDSAGQEPLVTEGFVVENGIEPYGVETSITGESVEFTCR